MHALETVARDVITTIRLSGMRTVHCVRAVRTALMALDAVESAEVQMGSAVLEHRDPIATETIRGALDATPYAVESVTSNARTLRVM
ncbi:MAG: heavy-metal-associated domain-containing protein [Gemmatimonadetes bacterium]|nr:heavy-metal-associated domain-containing protein [Gemmatimonadota bacterium]